MKRSSPVNMFGARMQQQQQQQPKIAGATYYNRKVERVRRKTEPTEAISIPRSNNASPRGGSPNNGSPRGGSPSGGAFYAGAKFSEPPSPASLPKPPMHWMEMGGQGCAASARREDQYQEISNQLKLMLNIRA